MTKVSGVLSLVGVGFLAVGFIMTMIPAVSGSIPDTLILLGIIFLFLWPVAFIMRPGTIRSRLLGNATLITGIVLIMGILILINVVGTRYAIRSDTTRSGRFSLAQQSRNMLQSLPAPVEALAFFPEGDGLEAKDLLVEYAAVSRNFTYRFIDPDRHPEEAINHKIRDYGTVVFTMKDKTERITTHTENHYTSALSRMLSDETRSLFFITGHNERRMSDGEKEGMSIAVEQLRDDGYIVEERLLMRDGLPAVTDVLIFAGTGTRLLPTEIDSIRVFLQRGGRIFLGLEPHPAPGFEEVLGTYGIDVHADILLDASGVGSLFGMSEVVPLIADYDMDHDITRTFNAATFFPVCRSLALRDSMPEGATASCLARTSDASWGETGALDAEEISFDEGLDIEGPACVMIAVERAPDPGGASDDSTAAVERAFRLVVTGDIDFASNGYLGISANRDLFMNCISWLSEREELIGIRSADEDAAPIMLSAQAARSVFYLVVFIIPGIVLAIGLSVWLKRR